jgi:N-acyl amino acid synthase of PEP-CTERM/exosortase system
MNIPFPPPGDEIPRLIPKSALKGARPVEYERRAEPASAGFSGFRRGISSPAGVRTVFVFLQISLFGELSFETVKMEAAPLRYRVFCRECRILPESNYPDGRELDEYDEHGAAHFGLQANGELAGYARLLIRGPRPLPFFRLCPDTRDLLRGMGIRRLAEVSRVMVGKHFRNREGDDRTGLNASPSVSARPDRRVLPATLGLYREIVAYGLLHGFSHFVVLMEPGLDRLLRSFAIRFREVGKPIDYGGMVCPYLLDISRMLRDMACDKPKIFSYFAEGLPESAHRRHES